MPRMGVNLKSRNVLILCCDNIPLANTKALYVLQRIIMRLVLVGLNVAMALQKRQCTVRSHESVRDKLLLNIVAEIYSAKRERLKYNIRYSGKIINSCCRQAILSLDVISYIICFCSGIMEGIKKHASIRNIAYGTLLFRRQEGEKQ